ncbi:hypothetical protein F5887DRAFT_916923 [Amanita rubescens]|nr:hypothetical protein F5887DRAFT_916923 [Amanita rubescens]
MAKFSAQCQLYDAARKGGKRRRRTCTVGTSTYYESLRESGPSCAHPPPKCDVNSILLVPQRSDSSFESASTTRALMHGDARTRGDASTGKALAQGEAPINASLNHGIRDELKESEDDRDVYGPGHGIEELKPEEEQILDDDIEEMVPRALNLLPKTNHGFSSDFHTIYAPIEPTLVPMTYEDARHFEAGAANINAGFTSPHNECLIVHDSEGYEPGDEEKFRILEKSITERSQKETIGERFHAIWLCITAPYVVYTKFDLSMVTNQRRTSRVGYHTVSTQNLATTHRNNKGKYTRRVYNLIERALTRY